jgi:hypothetical protein
VRQPQYGTGWTERSADRHVSASSVTAVRAAAAVAAAAAKGKYSVHLEPSGHYMFRQGFNIHKFYVLPTQCIYVFCVDLRTNSDYFPIQH